MARQVFQLFSNVGERLMHASVVGGSYKHVCLAYMLLSINYYLLVQCARRCKLRQWPCSNNGARPRKGDSKGKRRNKKSICGAKCSYFSLPRRGNQSIISAISQLWSLLINVVEIYAANWLAVYFKFETLTSREFWASLTFTPHVGFDVVVSRDQFASRWFPSFSGARQVHVTKGERIIAVER